MKRTVVILAVVALAMAGCKKKEEVASKGIDPQLGQHVADMTSGADPHAGMQSQEIPAGAGHKAKVLSTMDAGQYTYLEVEEKGQKLWVAVLKTSVKVGDIVEFPDSSPMTNFNSPTLKRTFDKIIFAPGIRVAN